MTKKEVVEQEVVEQEVVESTPVEVIPARLVTLEDGSVVDFGVRANVLVDIDQDTQVIAFALSNGKKISWVISGLENLTPFQVQVYLYGLASKVKSSLARFKDLTEVEAAIHKQIESIDSGVFILRSGKEASLSLSNLQKAYAIVKSQEEAFASWINVDSEEVIKEVLARWETFSTANKNALRKNAYIKLEVSKLEVAEAKSTVLL